MEKYNKLQIEKNLFFDDLDLFILKSVFEDYKNKREGNTWDMAKLFVSKKNGKKIEDKFWSKYKSEINYLYITINRKMSLYEKFGIIKTSINGQKSFNLDLDKIAFAKHKFSDGFKECIIIRL